MTAPVDGSGSWPACTQIVLNLASCRSFTMEYREPLEFRGVEPSTRAAIGWKWLTTSFAGRTLALGAALKVVSAVLQAGISRSSVVAAIDTTGDVLIVVAALTIGYYLFVDLKRLILWRVRRKLTLSYIFIGFVPALLLITFFVLSGLLLFFSVSAYSVRMQFNALQDQVKFLAQTAAVDLARGTVRADMERALRSEFNSVAGRYPLVSYVVVPAARECTRSPSSAAALVREAGPADAPPLTAGE